MSKKGKTKLEELLEWKKRPFLDKMLDDGVSPNQCAQWCREQGFEISTPHMYTYAKRRKEAIVKDVQMDAVMDKRQANLPPQERKKLEKKGGRKKAEPFGNMTQEERKQANMTVDKVKSDLELLDAIIQKGMETLHMMEAVAPQVAIKAIEIKNKITGGAHNGITTYGLEEIRLREAARENAILAILLKYIPEDKHDEVLAEMEKATREYYESIGLGEAYAALEVEEEAVND